MRFLKHFSLLTALIAFFSLGSVQAQTSAQARLVGTVINHQTQEVIPFAVIKIKGTTLGTSTDANGAFRLTDIPAGTYTVEASSLGFAPVEQRVRLEAGKTRHLDLYLDEQALELDGLVITSNRQETRRRMAPSLVTVLGRDLFAKTHSENLSQGLRFQPGLRIEDNCQNCGFNQVRINGLEGAYSQILIDSRPVFSALVGVYGLEQIPASMIEQVEVMRGGGSALFGSNAIGGVINIITREPLRSEAQLTQTLTTYDRKVGGYSGPQSTTSFNVSLVSEDHRAAIMAFGQQSARAGHDYDGDSFTELPELRNRALGFRAYYKMGLYSKLSAEFRSLHEHRRGGDRLERPPFEAQIAEYLQHFINGGSIRYDLGSEDDRYRLSAYASAQQVHRHSYYGGGDLVDGQLDKLRKNPANDAIKDEILASLTAYGRTKGLDVQTGATWLYRLPIKLDLTLGAEATFSSINDQSGFRAKGIDQLSKTYSQFTQLEYRSDRWTFLFGGRLDYVQMLQAGKQSIDPLLILSPRANLRYNPIKDLSLRLTYSEGFRAPQFFDEDMHVELAGGEPVSRVLSPTLREERSRSFSASADWYFTSGFWQYNLMLEGFATFLRNQFIASPIEKEVDGVRQRTIVNDSKGVAKVFGTTLEAKMAYRRLFEVQMGMTLQRSRYGTPRVFVDEDVTIGQSEVRSQDYDRTPNLYGYLSATLRPTKRLSLNLSSTYTGPMNVLHEAYEGIETMPQHDGKGHFDIVEDGQRMRGVLPGYAHIARSKSFFDLNLKLGYEVPLTSTITLDLSAGVQNILDAYQKDTDMGPGRASTYVYGPTLPRRAFVSATLRL